MGLLTANYWRWRIAANFLSNKTHINGNTFGLTQLNPEFGGRIVAFAGRKSAKKLKRIKEQQSEVKLDSSKNSFNDDNGEKDSVPSKIDTINDDFALVNERSELNLVTNDVPSRGTVLRACTVTSGLIAALGLAIREVWHLELVIGLVVLISLSRYTLLKIWPDFSESSEGANRQVLTSLEAYDYLIVAFLPGISEELLFRGGLLPLLGLNWKSALAVAALFGVLHLGSGRKSSFAIWATFVGFAYGYATIVSSSLVVPMASHALNNLVGALLWQQTSRSSKQISS
uniref:CAAX prenyl protease 2/Lysostaphin resistance protein A-like domain-containing protein n=1 Tax=Chenopodium quinoa TaxID=63459 RepID=A0A803L104_CHEQI